MLANDVIARPYAKAVFALALEHNNLNAWSKILEFLSYVAADIQVQQFLKDPRVAKNQRAALFLDVCKSVLDKSAKNLIYVLAEKQRLEILPAIADLFQELCREQEKQLQVEVKSVIELTETEKQNLKQALTKKFASDVELNFAIDENLLAGILLRIGDLVIDGSMKGQLERLKKCLIM